MTACDPPRARCSLPRRVRSRICARSYSAIIPWNWRSSSSSGEPERSGSCVKTISTPARPAPRAAAPGRRSGARADPGSGTTAPRTLPRQPGRAAARARTGERRAGEALIAEHQLLVDDQAAPGGGSRSPASYLRSSLPRAGARRTPARRSPPPCPSPARPCRSSSLRSLPVTRCRSAPRPRTPAPAARGRACQPRTRPQRALPPCRSRA